MFCYANYSDRIVSTGFDRAAELVCQVTAIMAIRAIVIPDRAKIHQGIEVR